MTAGPIFNVHTAYQAFVLRQRKDIELIVDVCKAVDLQASTPYTHATNYGSHRLLPTRHCTFGHGGTSLQMPVA